MDIIHCIELLRICDYQCSFCDRRQGFRPTPSGGVARALREGRARGARVVRFSGGEPALDHRLPRWVEDARALGYEEVEVETNGSTLSSVHAALGWARGGVDRVWLLWLPEAVADSLTGVPQAAQRQHDVLTHLAKAGSPTVALSMPVTPESAPGLAQAIEQAHASYPTLERIQIYLVAEAFSPAWPHPELEEALLALVRRCRRLRIQAALEPSRALPPCAFSDAFLEAAPSLLGGGAGSSSAKTRSLFEQRAACSACPAQPRCPGVRPTHASLALRDGISSRSAQAVASVLGGYARHVRSRVSELHLAEGASSLDEPDKANVRIAWACNERCQFCWVDFDWIPPTRETVLAEINALRQRGHRRVALTGGEPTMVPWLPDIVREARRLGFDSVQVQTNAVLLAKDGAAARLAAAGLTSALVSLHAPSAAVSDAITGLPGAYGETIAGIDALLAANVPVQLSFVLTSLNAAMTRDYVDMVATRWQERTPIVWALAHPITSASSRDAEAIPPLDVAGPALLKGLERCLEQGISFSNVNESCGAPPCALGFDPRFAALVPGHARQHPAFTYGNTCSGCAARPGCRGVRLSYLELHGERGLRAATAEEATALERAERIEATGTS